MMGNNQDRMTLINNRTEEENNETVDYVTKPNKNLKLTDTPTRKGLSNKRWSKNRKVKGDTNFQYPVGNSKRNSAVLDGGNMLWETKVTGVSPMKTYSNRNKQRRLNAKSLSLLDKEDGSSKVEKWLEKTQSSDPVPSQEIEEEQNLAGQRNDVPDVNSDSEPSSISKCSEIYRLMDKSSPPKPTVTKKAKVTATNKKRKKRKSIRMPVAPKRKPPKPKAPKKESKVKGKPLKVNITTKPPKVKLNKDGELTFRKDSFYRYYLRNREGLSDEKRKTIEELIENDKTLEEGVPGGLEQKTTPENSDISDLWLNEVCDEKNSKKDDKNVDDNGETPPMENQSKPNPSKRKLFTSKRFLNLVEEVSRERQSLEKQKEKKDVVEEEVPGEEELEEGEDWNEEDSVSTCFLVRSSDSGFIPYDPIFIDRSLREGKHDESGVSDCLFSLDED